MDEENKQCPCGSLNTLQPNSFAKKVISQIKVVCRKGCGKSVLARFLYSHELNCTGQAQNGSDPEELDFKENESENKNSMVQSVPQLVTNNNFNVLLNMAMNETTSTFKSTDQK